MPLHLVRGTTFSANADEHMKGWIVGHMHEGLAGSKEFEIKLWSYPEPFNYPPKIFHGTECIVVYGGVLELQLEKDGDKETVVLGDGEYIIIEPHLEKRVIVRKGPTYGITVRWPSGPGVNEVKR